MDEHMEGLLFFLGIAVLVALGAAWLANWLP